MASVPDSERPWLSDWSGSTAQLEHVAAQAAFGASVFWLRRLAAWESEATAIEYWQVKRGGDRRGIIEIISEAP